MWYVISQSEEDFFTWNATTGVPRPKSTPSTSMSTCEASPATDTSRLSQASDPPQDRFANPPFLAAPTVTLTPVTNFVSNLPYPSSQTTSRVCPEQTLKTTQVNPNKRRVLTHRIWGGRVPEACGSDISCSTDLKITLIIFRAQPFVIFLCLI